MHMPVVTQAQWPAPPEALRPVQPAAPRRHPLGQRSDDNVLQRPAFEDVHEARRQQIERDDQMASGLFDPLGQLLGDHERTELQGRGARPQA